jgi:RNA polymerase sigma-70 factor, ECF subfamily
MATPTAFARTGERVSSRLAQDSIEALRAGDPAAAHAFVREHGPRVQRLLIRLLGPRQDLEDLVQNTFLEALRALPGFEGRSELSTFVLGIAVHVAQRAMRPRKLDRLRVGLDHADQLAGPVRLDERASQAEALRRVRRYLAEVAEPKRIAFMLWALDGMPVEQVAEVTGAGLAATRSRIFYAQKELKARAALDPYLAEWLTGEEP